MAKENPEHDISCECCRRTKATIKDFRFINSINVEGKVLVCKYCYNLNDVEFYKEYIKEV